MTRTKKILIGAGSLFVIAILAMAAWVVISPLGTSLAQSPSPTLPAPYLAPGAGGQTITPGTTTGTTPTNPWAAYQDAFMNAFATRLGTTVDKIKQALIGAFGDVVDQAVKDGNLTQDQATQMKNDATDRFSQGIPFGFFGRGGPGGFRGKGEFGLGGLGGFHGEMDLAAFATALNMNESDLMTELQSGKTLAQVVTEKNADLATVKTSVLAALKTNLDQAVSSGKLTQAQADELYNQAGTKFDNIVNQTWNQGGFDDGRGFGPRGFRGFKGGMDLAAFATALNMNKTDLMTELQSGNTLAQVVTEKNADLATVKTSVLAALKTNLGQAVSSGKLTQAQADQMYSQASTNFDTMVNQSWKDQGRPMQDGWPMQ